MGTINAIGDKLMIMKQNNKCYWVHSKHLRESYECYLYYLYSIESYSRPSIGFYHILTLPFANSNNGNSFPQSNGFKVTSYCVMEVLVTVAWLIKALFGRAGRRRRRLISVYIKYTKYQTFESILSVISNIE